MERDRNVIDLVRMHHCDAHVAVAAFGPLCIAIWRGEVTDEAFHAQRAGLAEVVLNHPEGAAFLSVIESSAKPPDEEMRHACVKMAESHGARLTCLGVVIEGEGFLAAVNRAVITGMIFLSTQVKARISVFAKVPDAGAFLRRRIPSLPPPEEIAAAVESVRRQLPPVALSA